MNERLTSKTLVDRLRVSFTEPLNTGSAASAMHEAANEIERLTYERDIWRDKCKMLRPVDEPTAALQQVMARLTELLDEDKFKDIEDIVTRAGVRPAVPPNDDLAAKVQARIDHWDDEIAKPDVNVGLCVAMIQELGDLLRSTVTKSALWRCKCTHMNDGRTHCYNCLMPRPTKEETVTKSACQHLRCVGEATPEGKVLRKWCEDCGATLKE
jgi:hypothetical protein